MLGGALAAPTPVEGCYPRGAAVLLVRSVRSVEGNFAPVRHKIKGRRWKGKERRGVRACLMF